MMPRAALILQNDDPVIEDEEDEDDEDDDDDEDEGEAEGKSLQNVILGLLCEWSMFHLFLQATDDAVINFCTWIMECIPWGKHLS